jgi:hypothetical protein
VHNQHDTRIAYLRSNRLVPCIRSCACSISRCESREPPSQSVASFFVPLGFLTRSGQRCSLLRSYLLCVRNWPEIGASRLSSASPHAPTNTNLFQEFLLYSGITLKTCLPTLQDAQGCFSASPRRLGGPDERTTPKLRSAKYGPIEELVEVLAKLWKPEVSIKDGKCEGAFPSPCYSLAVEWVRSR